MDGRVAAVESLKIKSNPFHRARIKHNRRGERMLLSTLLLVIMICPLRFTYAGKPSKSLLDSKEAFNIFLCWCLREGLAIGDEDGRKQKKGREHQFLTGKMLSARLYIPALDVVRRESPSNKFSVIGRSFRSMEMSIHPTQKIKSMKEREAFLYHLMARKKVQDFRS